MTRKAFTLVEVLVSVVIIVTVGLGLLKVGSNSTKLISYTQKKSETNSAFSAALLNTDSCEDKETNLYDLLKTNFNIKDDKLISVLREQNISCESVEIANINLADSDELTRDLQDVPKIGFVINKISARMNGGNVVGYEIKALR